MISLQFKLPEKCTVKKTKEGDENQDYIPKCIYHMKYNILYVRPTNVSKLRKTEEFHLYFIN